MQQYHNSRMMDCTAQAVVEELGTVFRVHRASQCFKMVLEKMDRLCIKVVLYKRDDCNYVRWVE